MFLFCNLKRKFQKVIVGKEYYEMIHTAKLLKLILDLKYSKQAASMHNASLNKFVE